MIGAWDDPLKKWWQTAQKKDTRQGYIQGTKYLIRIIDLQASGLDELQRKLKLPRFSLGSFS